MAAGPGTFEEDLAETKAGLVSTLSRMSAEGRRRLGLGGVEDDPKRKLILAKYADMAKQVGRVLC